VSRLYLYAIIDHPDVAACVLSPGIAGATVSTLTYAEIAAVISRLEGDLVICEETLWLHEGIVEKLMTEHTVLPVRLNTVVDDEQKLVAVLAQNYQRLLADLARVRGKVELAVRVFWHGRSDRKADARVMERKVPLSSSGTTIGRDYMAMRLQEERHQQIRRQCAQSVVQVIHGKLSDLAAESDCKVLATPEQVMTAAYLLGTDCVGAFGDRIAELAARYPELRILCTGPWPPYSFVQTRVV